MPTNYALRTPIYASASSSVTTTQSAKCLVSVAGTVVYTIIKSASANTTVTFEIAELVRDYLNISYIGNPQFVVFTSTIQFFDQPNAGGTAQATPEDTTSGNGYEAYGLFSEGINPTIPFENVQLPAWLIAEANPLATSANDRYYIYVPFGVSGKTSYIDASGNIAAISYTTTDTFIVTPSGLRLNIQRIDCTKYGDGRMITFINKFGVIQDLWFFLKRVKKINRTNESYMSNTLTFDSLGVQPPNYSQTNAPKKLLNTQAKQTHVLSSGYYPESANLFFEQLLLSEYVWYTRPEDTQPNTDHVTPVIVKTSSITYKTSLNDRLIDYTIEFEDAFDYINNIR
tara:strand:- start:1876 stop:2901 length:1026 start_codon:yes stop_codon:yes gene_type:complete